MQRGPMTEQRPRGGQFNFRSFMQLIRKTKPIYWQLWVGLVLSLIATGMQLAVPKAAESMINGFKNGISEPLIIGVIVLFLVSALVSSLSGSLLGFFGESIVSELRKLIWSKLLKLKVSYFDETKSGEMTSRLINDSSQVKELVANSFPNLVSALITIVGALVLMVMMDWKMTLIMALAIPLVMVIMLPIAQRTRQIGRSRQDEMAKFNGQADETLSEIRLVKSSDAEPYESKLGFKSIKSLYQIGLKEAIYDAISGPLMTTVMLALFVGVLGYGAVRVSQGTMSLGKMFSFFMYLFQLMSPAMILGQFVSTLGKASGSTERIQDLLAAPEEKFGIGDDVDVEGKTLSMEHVDFGYDNSTPILKDVSFTAKPSTVVAFAGPSGGGKSTIFSLLERFYQPDFGKINIGDTDINNIDLNSWRKQIGFVSQDSAIKAGTIRDNLTYGLTGEYSDEQLWNVLQLAYADKFVHEMPDGLDTQVGERGVKVSGGQRQRIAIARAFLRDPKILMLDEATASLDSESEAMVQKALDQLMKGRTTLVIAHRLSTIVGADNIYFIEHGQVSGSGTHSELVKSHELYREYVATQFDAATK
ncbi:ABC transporter ATP-binding protein [Lentilactobacillus sp. SPB1-3]|uniref:ABC transporter ATP-binding protein n=1 Tax=Lentilactobacillus terminaliae TaxID=3003483 RepID=A0ACD5DF89_9LACO|nr:ABC transporter ATP-binding protein [Lentilactobacillus sp. SPB1-3]MCZ0976599.1 ABC transporter ATP-binding protein [Lentilactobacillus sp. SPB1-3]